MLIPAKIQHRITEALADLEDLEKDIQKALADYSQDGKISTIFAYNRLTSAHEILNELVEAKEPHDL